MPVSPNSPPRFLLVMSERQAKTREQREQEQKQRDAEARLAATNLRNLVVHLMKDTQGRRFMDWILLETRVDNVDYGPNALQTYETLGEQKLGRRLQKLMLSECPDLYAQMVKENRK